MNTKVASFVMIVVLTSLACNAITSLGTSPSIVNQIGTSDVTPLVPSSTPDLTQPRIQRVLYGFAYASQSEWRQAELTPPYPHTHLPNDANVLAAVFFLDIPEGWPSQRVELRSQWYLGGMPLENSEGIVICSLDSQCNVSTTRYFSTSGFEKGRIEARLYLGNELLQGPETEVWLIDEEWLGDLRLMQCDRGTADSCENDAGHAEKFSDPVTIPVGSRAVYVGNAYANLPAGSSWQVALYWGEQLIDSKSHTTTGSGTWSGWQVTQLVNPRGVALQSGTYTVKLLWKGGVLEIISFEVE